MDSKSSLSVNPRLQMVIEPLRKASIYRFVVGMAWILTILLTWKLWQAREVPPNIGFWFLPLPNFDIGVWLCLVPLLPLFWPRFLSLFLSGLVVLLALLQDQIRMQPEVISLFLLMSATLAAGAGPGAKDALIDEDSTGGAAGPGEGFLLSARIHLITLWLFAGLNKFLSANFLFDPDPWLLKGIWNDAPALIKTIFPWVAASLEVSLGIMALVPGARRLAALGGLCLHGGILITLSPLGHNWNQAVWPWNLALIFAGFYLLWDWKTSLLSDLRKLARPFQVFAVLLFIYPLGFYFGISDAYLSHNLYSNNTLKAYWLRPEGKPRKLSGWKALGVPFPPEERIYRGVFNKICRPGDELLLIERRLIVPGTGKREWRLSCPGPIRP